VRDGLTARDGRLSIAGHDAEQLARERGTPLFVYDPRRPCSQRRTVTGRTRARRCASPLNYALKANRHPQLLATLRALGNVGLDVCSPNEVTLALESGWRPDEISYTGTNLSERDLDVILAQPLILNLDSLSAIRRVARRAPGRAIGLRINPQIGTGYSAQLTYAGDKPTKFGIYADRFDEALALGTRARAGRARTALPHRFGLAAVGSRDVSRCGAAWRGARATHPGDRVRQRGRRARHRTAGVGAERRSRRRTQLASRSISVRSA
jgi:diaminopimelate decarboxylase